MLFKDITARTAELLMELQDKSAEPCPDFNGNRQDIGITHQEAADMLGAARPVVSGVLSRMSKAGLIRKHGQTICLLDREGLQTVYEQGALALEGK